MFSRANIIVHYVNRKGFKFNGTRHFMVCAEVNNLQGGKVNVIKIKTEAVIVPITAFGLEIYAEQTKHIYIFTYQENANGGFCMHKIFAPL